MAPEGRKREVSFSSALQVATINLSEKIKNKRKNKKTSWEERLRQEWRGMKEENRMKMTKIHYIQG